jgi:hypothetical protein
MRKAEINEQNQRMIRQQQEFRLAADIVAKAWTRFEEIEAIAVIGSLAKALWKEIPRFSDFRRAGIEVWHECKDVDLAVWISSQHRLGELRRASHLALRSAFEAGAAMSVPGNRLDVFLFQPGTNVYLGRLCDYNACPKGKRDCMVPGCGDIPFNKQHEDFSPEPNILAGADKAMLYRRGEGALMSALDLPEPDETQPKPERPWLDEPSSRRRRW